MQFNGLTYTLVISQGSVFDLPVLTTFNYIFDCNFVNHDTNNLSQCYQSVITDYCDQHLFVECEGIIIQTRITTIKKMFLLIL